ncbi:MAG: acyl-CoA dehydrogenase [Pseudomonadota bacterium]
MSNASNTATEDMTQMLQDAAADFCKRALPRERLRAIRDRHLGFDKTQWIEMCELGWTAILVDEANDGLGLGIRAAGAVCEQLGRVAAPEPMIESGVASIGLINELAPEHSAVPAILNGENVVTAVLDDHDLTVDDEHRVSGRARAVSLATVVDAVLLSATTGDGKHAVYYMPLATDGCKVSALTMADGSSAAELRFDHCALSAEQCLSRDAAAAVSRARQLASLATSAYLVGAASAVYDLTMAYLKTRQQFGATIGSFQGLQHRAVDLYLQKEMASAVVLEALDTFDRAADEQAREVTAARAKYRASTAALHIAKEAVQMHGAIGFTDEADVGLYLNRVLVLAARHGNASQHCRTLGDLLNHNIESDTGEAALPDPIDTPPGDDWNNLSDDQFRASVRAWFESNYPSELRYPPQRLRWAEIKDWYLKLSEHGWVAPAWPREHGGMGLSPSKLLIFYEEQERHGVARAPDMGIQMVGPLLIQHGNDDQRARYLPKIISCDTVWCQGYSEPNAGSDLASLRTEAIQDGDEFVINGQKTWTTLAQDATHMFCLARTSKEGKQQEGISFFLIDLAKPGATIRPIRNIAGHEEFCEVFLDNVRVPAEDLVGEINQGWTIAKALLGFERIFLGSPKQCQFAMRRLEEMAHSMKLFDDASFADRFTKLKLDTLDLESLYVKFADIVRRGEKLGPDVSVLKIWATETFARLSELMVEAAGPLGGTTGKLDFGETQTDVLSQFYNARPATIYAGSNEIQRNIVSKLVLGLPSK